MQTPPVHREGNVHAVLFTFVLPMSDFRHFEEIQSSGDAEEEDNKKSQLVSSGVCGLVDSSINADLILFSLVSFYLSGRGRGC